MYIYIDANIYLDYFKMSEETLVSLNKLKILIEKNKKYKLILPVQTKDEFFRNKNNVISQCLMTTNNDIKKAVSLLSRHYKQRRIEKSANRIKRELERFNKELKGYLTSKNSEINNIIDSLFNLSIEKEDNAIIFDKAYKRLIKGNPPGKNGSIGDAIAWETLLQECLNEALYIITKDGDWIDEIDEDKLRLFLLLEWEKKSSKKIFLFKSIGAFVNNLIPEAKISDKVIKEEKSISRPISYTYIDNADSSGAWIAHGMEDATKGIHHTYGPIICNDKGMPIISSTSTSAGNWQYINFTEPAGDSVIYTHKKEAK